jgi:hypothetical protein
LELGRNNCRAFDCISGDSAIRLGRDGDVRTAVVGTLAPLVDPGADGSIGQQAEGGSDEEDDNDLVLCRVALEARGRDVVVLFGLAERVAQAELAVAVVAGAPCGAGV